MNSYVLSDCDRTEKEFKCVSTCESVWFKIWNITAAGSIGAACDKAFIGKYESVMYNKSIDVIVGSTIARVDQLTTLCMWSNKSVRWGMKR